VQAGACGGETIGGLVAAQVGRRAVDDRGGFEIADVREMGDHPSNDGFDVVAVALVPLADIDHQVLVDQHLT